MSLIDLDKINLKLPPTWQIPFYEFIARKLTLKEFEKELYKSSELEFMLGEDLYIELLSFDFTNAHVLNNVISFIFEKILVEEDEYDCRLFTLIGKFYMEDIVFKTRNATTLPEAVINIFSGTHIDVTWQGIECAAFGIEFLSEVFYDKFKNDCRKSLPSSAVAIAIAGSYMSLLMDNEGIVYIDLNIIDKIYCAGEFFEALKRVFFGLDYGKVLCANIDGLK